MIATKVTCDVCGKEKQDVNHWWMGHPGAISAGWAIHVWVEDVAHLRDHYCGQECAIKALSEWMQKTK